MNYESLSGERPNTKNEFLETEQPSKTDYSTLRNEVSFTPKEIPASSTPQSHQQKESRLSEIRSRLRSAYVSAIDSAYKGRLRSKIDSYKGDMYGSGFHGLSTPGETVEPTPLQKATRTAIDLIPISIPPHQQTMNRSAVRYAVEEYRNEEATREAQQKAKAAQEESDRRLKEYYEKKAQVKERLEKESEELIATMDKYRQEKQKSRQLERIRELTERKFNEVLTTIDQLQEAVDAGEDGISLSKIEYGDKKIPVYELKGYPMRWLQHAVDYRGDTGGEFNHAGLNTSKRIIADPSKWDSNISDMERYSQDYNPDMMTDNISASYVDADINLNSNSAPSSGPVGLNYCFSHIPSGGLLNMKNKDAGTPLRMKENIIKQYESPEDFATHLSNPRHGYNEVVLRRYDEQGKALRPDFLTVRDGGHINSAVLHHATHWNIPIVRIHDGVYRKQAIEKIANQIERLDETAPYQVLLSAIQSANSSNMFDSSFLPLKKAYISPEKDTYLDDIKKRDNTDILGSVGDKFRHLVTEIEPARRIDFIKEALTTQDQEARSNIEVDLHTTELKHDEHYIPTYGTKITIKIPNIPETSIREDSPEYTRIMPAIETYQASGGLIHDFTLPHNTH